MSPPVMAWPRLHVTLSAFTSAYSHCCPLGSKPSHSPGLLPSLIDCRAGQAREPESKRAALSLAGGSGRNPRGLGEQARAGWMRPSSGGVAQKRRTGARKRTAPAAFATGAPVLWRKPPCGGEFAIRYLAPEVGFEPTTLRLTAGCSTVELLRNKFVAPAKF